MLAGGVACLSMRYAICLLASGAGVCAIVSGLSVYCKIIFTRSRVLVLGLPGCVGGREIHVCFVEELGL